jgi:hypothetical protein
MFYLFKKIQAIHTYTIRRNDDQNIVNSLHPLLSNLPDRVAYLT